MMFAPVLDFTANNYLPRRAPKTGCIPSFHPTGEFLLHKTDDGIVDVQLKPHHSWLRGFTVRITGGQVVHDERRHKHIKTTSSLH